MFPTLRNALGSGGAGAKIAVGVAVVAGATLGTATAFASPGHQSTHLTRPALAVHHAKSVSHAQHTKGKSHAATATHRHVHAQAAKTGNDPVPVVDPTPGDDSDNDAVTDPSDQGDHHGNCDHEDGSYGPGDDDQGEDSGNHDGYDASYGPGGGNDQGGPGGGGSWGGQHD